SFLGFQSQSVAVEGRTSIDITLVESAEQIDDVVVIGYGTQRREAVTGSVATMGGDVVREVPAGDITSALMGRIAGVEMSPSSARPGQPMQIRIRGTRSLTASNDPLIVLDGIPFAGNLNDIDPNNIKSLDILKDASSTAIYGSRGANGVIIISSKSGSRGEERPATLTYNGYYGIKNAERIDLMTGDQLYALKEYLKTAPAGTSGLYTSLGSDEKQGVNTDWQDLLLRQGWTTSHDIGVSGGSRSSSYSFGTTYYKDQGVLPTNNFTRYSLRANIDTQVGKWVRIGMNTNTNYNFTQGSQIGVDLQNSPLADPYNADGTLKRVVAMATDTYWVRTRDVVENNTHRWKDDTRRLGTFNTVYAEITAPWVEGLKYRINVGLNYMNTFDGEFTGRGINNSNENAVSTAQVDQNWRANWSVENLLTFDRVFNGKHSINAVALFAAEQTTFHHNRMQGRDYPNEDMLYWNIGQAVEDLSVSVLPGEQRYTQSGLVSYMGRAMYSYDSKYMISAAVRSDGSSRLAPGHQWHTYPAVSVGWNISEENFMQGASWLDALKLRVGYGQTSNQSVPEYSTLGRLGTRQLNMGNSLLTGLYFDQLANPNLGWEYTQTWNYGIDFTLLNNRLSGTIEYYTQKTHDVLQRVSLPNSGGVGSYTANVGRTENKGFELTLNGTIIDNNNGWNWTAGVNFSVNRNKLTALADGVTENRGNAWFVGYPINVYYNYVADGLWQEGDAYMNDYEPGSTPGSIRVKYTGEHDANGKPVRRIDDNDRQVINPEANFTGGFNTRVAWKNLDLTVIGTFQGGGLFYSRYYDGGGYNNLLSGRRGNIDVDYWRPDNTGAKWPNPYGLRSGDNIKYLDVLALFDASHLTISTITLGYTLPRKWMNASGFRNVRVYAMAQNPFVFFSPFKRETGIRPSTGEYTGADITQGTNRMLRQGGGVPFTKNFLFGVNLSF
ncbi:MAG: SusC/RagA family TonB-linked outer membrane protein, partial [Alistipes sp.]|nr:SusC/RagA family TonB-linked outer membrane protein [Alistipes sp.]